MTGGDTDLPRVDRESCEVTACTRPSVDVIAVGRNNYRAVCSNHRFEFNQHVIHGGLSGWLYTHLNHQRAAVTL